MMLRRGGIARKVFSSCRTWPKSSAPDLKIASLPCNSEAPAASPIRARVALLWSWRTVPRLNMSTIGGHAARGIYLGHMRSTSRSSLPLEVVVRLDRGVDACDVLGHLAEHNARPEGEVQIYRETPRADTAGACCKGTTTVASRDYRRAGGYPYWLGRRTSIRNGGMFPPWSRSIGTAKKCVLKVAAPSIPPSRGPAAVSREGGDAILWVQC
ncbi:hypothetical protein B0H67DRAFT_341780 [Lasiosphaeris hirsuta]|uniref:Uncharacterized protein n=1 Tax=Lasiosphaeris hirsuta TaxID=260670 RepID=A0AA40A3E2_9PEZI|nr:hypothetical protein B0H67DRAFT_341780 [Lasiosphaeris hirsuta]